MVTVDYLDEERKKLWLKLLELEDQIKKRTSDYENDARQASKKASEFRNKCEESKNSAQTYFEQTKLIFEEIDIIRKNFLESITHIDDLKKTSESNSEIITKISSQVNQQVDGFNKKNAELDEIYNSYDEYIEKIKTLDETLSKGNEYTAKVDAIYKNLVSKKGEIDKLYYEISGYTEKVENSDNEIIVEGLKNKLENSYKELETSLSNLKLEFEKINENIKAEYATFLNKSTDNTEKLITKWDGEIAAVRKKINDLLPDALTTGLSYAYYDKRQDELKLSGKLSNTFTKAILGLVIISLIPFAISVKTIFDGTSFVDVIFRIPRLVLAILPLYVPVLWVAYSASKKINLSKRLIEEYTHKEVLSKTVEGLSKQISNVDDKDISNELRTKLLFNILEISSENPGKLISDYNKSDHPLMDALDKSIKLTNAVNKLAKIPGFNKITSILDEKAKIILQKEADKAVVALESLSDEDKNS